MSIDLCEPIALAPVFEDHERSFQIAIAVAREIADLQHQHEQEVDATRIRTLKTEARIRARPADPIDYQPLCTFLAVLCDLSAQGWLVSVADEKIRVQRPAMNGDPMENKARVRRSLGLARDEQLSEPPVRSFVRSMSTRSHGPKGWTSIYSLMRDGASLGPVLRKTVREHQEVGPSVRELSGLIQPYLQFIDANARDQWTGLRLLDIWRYFRYTWLTPARSVPGRSMLILVRDSAVEPHPVIGIAALSSSIVQQTERDSVIGWDGRSVLSSLEADPSDRNAEWLIRSLSELLDGIREDDLITATERESPQQEIIETLRVTAANERAFHQVHARNLKFRQRQSAASWADLSGSHLYRSKRALALADLLWIRRVFVEAGFVCPNGDHLRTALQSSFFRRAVVRLVRYVKATHVGINMMDISVAGSVAPYNNLLGGKLVSLLLASPEVRNEYAARYGTMDSIIASAMKGQPVVRKPDLVLLCTTGLFAGGSSQYNRIRLPAEAVGGNRGEIRFDKLTKETEFATFHISQATMNELRIYFEQMHNGTGVHGIFGEGVNPKMRLLRDGLAKLGFPPEEILKAGSPRSVYMIPLAHNYREVLMGISGNPEYILPTENPLETTERIVDFWRKRWLAGRILQPAVIEAVEQHTLSYPIRHGAIVQLPEITAEPSLFGEEMYEQPEFIE